MSRQNIGGGWMRQKAPPVAAAAVVAGLTVAAWVFRDSDVPADTEPRFKGLVLGLALTPPGQLSALLARTTRWSWLSVLLSAFALAVVVSAELADDPDNAFGAVLFYMFWIIPAQVLVLIASWAWPRLRQTTNAVIHRRRG